MRHYFGSAQIKLASVRRICMKKSALGVIGVALLAPLAVSAQTIQPLQDAYVVPGNPSNYGAGTSLSVGSSSSQGLIQFDLTTLPAGLTASQIQKATLTLFVNHVGVPGTVNIYTANGAWTETGVNGNNAPSSCRRWRAASRSRPTNSSRWTRRRRYRDGSRLRPATTDSSSSPTAVRVSSSIARKPRTPAMRPFYHSY